MSATLDMMSLRFLIVSSAKDFLWLPDAWAHLWHYLGNSGKTYTIRFQKMIDDLKSLQAIRAGEIADARKFVMNLSDGTYNITSGRATNGYARFSESSNWFYAVGGYSVWGKGQVTVSNKQTCFEIKYEFKFEDRYNWDAGKSVNILGVTITDDFMGKFQRQGLAREFNMIGSVKQTIKWKKGDKAPVITEGWETPKGGR